MSFKFKNYPVFEIDHYQLVITTFKLLYRLTFILKLVLSPSQPKNKDGTMTSTTIFLNLFFFSGGSGHYDPHHRNPMYCNADKECIWELKMLANHFHPTVSLYASRLVKVQSYLLKCGQQFTKFTPANIEINSMSLSICLCRFVSAP